MLSSIHRAKALATKRCRFCHHLFSRNNFFSTISTDKVVVTAALNGVLTDPAKFDIPVTPDEMATAASEAYNAGASVVHIHFRDQRPGKGHLPSWAPKDAKAISDAIRQACPI